MKTSIKLAKKNSHRPPKPHLLIIQQSPDWGGAEEWIASLVGEWAKKKINITAYTNLPKLQLSWQQSGARVYNIPFILDIMGNLRGLIKSILLLPYAIFWYLKVLLLAKSRGVNLIVMSGFTEKLLVSWLSKIFSLPIIWFEYGDLKTIFTRNFYLPKIAYRLTKHIPQRVITISSHTKNSLITDARVSLTKIKLIPPGVSIPKTFHSTDYPIVGHLSRLTPEKGQRHLLKAWKKVIKALPNAKLKIAGRGPDSKYLHQLANKLNISESVEFLGFINKKAKFYNSLSLFIFPTIWEMEGFGIVAVEALSYGIPVVAYNTGPVPEIIDHTCGITVPSENIHQLAQAIINLLKNKRLRQKLSNKSKTKAKKQFNLTTQASKITKELTCVLAENQ